jgi:hypothetical protein
MAHRRGEDILIAFVIVVLLGKTAQRLGDIPGDRRLFSDDQCFSHAIRVFHAPSHRGDLCFPYRLNRKLLKPSSKSKTSAKQFATCRQEPAAARPSKTPFLTGTRDSG